MSDQILVEDNKVVDMKYIVSIQQGENKCYNLFDINYKAYRICQPQKHSYELMSSIFKKLYNDNDIQNKND